MDGNGVLAAVYDPVLNALRVSASALATALSNTFAPLPTALVTGRYYRVPNCTVSTSGALGIGTVRAFRKFIPNACTIATLGAEVTSAGEAGSHFRIGMWADTNGRAGTLVVDAGQIDGTSVTFQEKTINQAVTPGWYWFGGAVQDVVTTQPTMRTVSAILEPHVVDLGTSAPAAGALAFAGSYTGATTTFAGSFGTFSNVSAGPAIIAKIG